MRAIDPILATMAIATVSLAPQSLVRAVDVSEVLEGGQVIQSASFVGESDHTVSGQVEIIQKGEIFYLVLGEDFLFDGAPDPRLGFSNNDSYVESSTFSGLNLDSGKQIYRLPATLNVSDYDEITIWCEKFSVPLAEAKF